jgi:hypothetical protein
VRLEDGTVVLGVLGEPALVEKHREITAYGGWRSYLAQRCRRSIDRLSLSFFERSILNGRSVEKREAAIPTPLREDARLLDLALRLCRSLLGMRKQFLRMLHRFIYILERLLRMGIVVSNYPDWEAVRANAWQNRSTVFTPAA